MKIKRKRVLGRNRKIFGLLCVVILLATSLYLNLSNEPGIAEQTQAHYTKVGGEYAAATEAAGTKLFPKTAMAPGGDYYVVWGDGSDQDGGGGFFDQGGIYFQRFNSSGTKVCVDGSASPAGCPDDADDTNGVEPEVRANTTTTESQERADIDINASGEFVIIYESDTTDGSSAGVYGQKFDASGAPVGTEFLANTTTFSAQQIADVAIHSNGEFIVVWGSGGAQDGFGSGVFAQRFDSSGTKVCRDGSASPAGCPDDADDTNGKEPEFRINTYTAANESKPRIDYDSTGGFIVSWTSDSQDGDGLGVFAQRFNSSGTPICLDGSASPAGCPDDADDTNGKEPEFKANSTITGAQDYPRLAIGPSDQFLISWHGNGPGDTAGVFGQRFTSAGALDGTEFRANTSAPGLQSFNSSDYDGTGGFFISWVSNNGQDGSSWGSIVKRYTSAGVQIQDEFVANTTTSGTQIRSEIAADSVGNFAVAWMGEGFLGPQNRIYGQLFNTTAAGTPYLINTSPAQHDFSATSGGTITANFSEAIDTATATNSTFIAIGEKTGKHSGAFTFANGNATVILTPTTPFDSAGEKVTLILTTGIESSASNTGLDKPYIVEFWVGVTDGYGSFEQLSTTNFNNDPISIVSGDVQLADINADGDLDLLLSSTQRGVESWLGDGAGGFATPQNIVTPTAGISEAFMSVYPMDNNDSPDLVLKLASVLRVLQNDGSGNFSSEMTVDLGAGNIGTGDLAAADFDGDGDLDIAVAHTENNEVDIFLNNGVDTITYDANYALGDSYFYLETGDLDNDFDTDVILITDNGSVDRAKIIFNDGMAGFTVGTEFDPDGNDANINLAPFLTSNNLLHGVLTDAGGTTDHLTFLENNSGLGGFATSSIDTDLDNLRLDTQAGDFTGNGLPDFVISNDSFDYFSLYSNTSTSSPSFSAIGQVALAGIEDLAQGDVNGDGILDLIIIGDSGGNPFFTVWAGAQTAPLAVTDLAGSGTPDSVVLTWTAPFDGGSAITDYIVEYGVSGGFPGNAATFSDGVSASTGATVTGLTLGVSYSFRVYAVNAIGTGPASNTAVAPTQASWVLDTTDSLANAVQGAVAVEYNGKIYHFGGSDGGAPGNHYDTVQIYDPTAPAGSRWTEDTTDPMPEPRSHGGAVEVGGKIYYINGRSEGGNNFEDSVFIYDPAGSDTNRWSLGTPLGFGGNHSFAYAADGTEIYLVGGFVDDGEGGVQDINDLVSYDTVGDSWTTGYASMPNGRAWLTGQIIDGFFYVSGGSSNDLYVYDISGDSWSQDANYPLDDLQEPCSATYDGKFYVISGIDGNLFDEYLEVYKYDPDLDLWTQAPSLNNHRKRCSAVTLGDTIYTFSGNDFILGDNRDDFETLDVTPPPPSPFPIDPTLISPADMTTYGNLNRAIVLSAQYSHGTLLQGVTNYRVTITNAPDCLSGSNLFDSGTSALTPDGNEATTYTPVGIVDGNTYYWCAQNDDLTNQTAWITMGEFTVDFATPYLDYSTYLGGGGTEYIFDITVFDEDIYAVGETSASNFPITTGAFQEVYGGSGDIFVTRLSPDGNGTTDIVFSTFIGDSWDDRARALIVDDNGDIYITGHTRGLAYPTTAGAFNEVKNDVDNDVLFTIVSADGSSLVYSTVIVANDDHDYGYDLVLDGGLVYITGETRSINFPVTAGAYDQTQEGFSDAFLAVIDPAGGGVSDLVYATYLGGDDTDLSRGLAVNGGIAYLIGRTDGGTFPIFSTGTPFQSVFGDAGLWDGFFTGINPAGGGASDLVYSSYVGGNSYDELYDIDNNGGDFYVGGSSQSTDFPTTTGAFAETKPATSSFTDGVLFIFNPLGNGTSDLTYGTYIGGAGDHDYIEELEYANGLIYLTGTAESTSFPVSSDAYDPTANGSDDVFLTIIDPAGGGFTDLVYSTYLGSSINEEGYGVAYDSNRAYVGGWVSGNGFPTTDGAFSNSWTPGQDGFLSCFDFSGTGAGCNACLEGGYPVEFGSSVTYNYYPDQSCGAEMGDCPGGVNLGDCPAGSVLTGLKYYEFAGGDDWIDGAGTVCTDLDSAGVLGAKTYNNFYPNDACGAEMGDCPNKVFGGECPAGEVVTGIKYYSNPNPNSDRTEALGFLCSALSGGGATEVSLSGRTPNNYYPDDACGAEMGDCPNTIGGFECAPGSAVIGFQYYDFVDDYVDGVGVKCSEIAGGGNACIAGGGGSSSQVTQQQQQGTLPVPTIDKATPISTNTIQFDWLYSGTNQTGFKLYGANMLLLKDLPGTSIRSVQQASYTANTLITGHKLSAYNSTQESAKSSAWPDTYTLIEPVTPVLVSRVGSDVTVKTLAIPTNLKKGKSGVQFELHTDDEVISAVDTPSLWTQETSYTFTGIDPELPVEIRARSRNQAEVETSWSPYLPIAAEEVLPATLGVSLSLTTIDGNPLPTPMNSQETIFGTMIVTNTGGTVANNVFVDLPIPEYLFFVPGSLQVEGSIQSDGADEDAGQTSNNFISAIWSELLGGESRSVTFQLRFEQESLRVLANPVIEEKSSDDLLIGNELEDIQREIANDLPLAIVQASAELQRASVLAAVDNPQLVLQATASASNVANPVQSNPVVVEPNLVPLMSQPPVVPPVPPTPPTPPTPPSQQQQGTSQPPSQQSTGTQPPSGGGLLLTAQGQAVAELIEFSGTTSEPNSTVTIIFNGTVTRIVVSDENGVWRVFISADELGIGPGEDAIVSVESIAHKDGLESNRVLQTVSVIRAIEGEVVVDIQPQVASQNIVQEIVLENEQPIQRTLIATAPIVVIASVPLWGYLPYVPTLLYHFIIWILGLFSKKKEGEQYGVVYNSITKEPLPLAIVRIYNKETNKLVTTEVTDKQGRYEYLLPPGEYRIEVKKPQYNFPSKIVNIAQDGDYLNVYRAEAGFTVGGGLLSLPDIPVDPFDAKRRFSIANIIKKGWLTLQAAGHYLALPVLFLGAAISLFMVYTVPSVLNWILAILYVLMFILQLVLREHRERAWGVVYEVATNAALPLTSLQLIDPEFGKVVKSRLSDYQGRFAFLPEPGKYVIKANKVGYQQADIVEGGKDRKPISGEIQIQKEGEHLKGDVAMRLQDT